MSTGLTSEGRRQHALDADRETDVNSLTSAFPRYSMERISASWSPPQDYIARSLVMTVGVIDRLRRGPQRWTGPTKANVARNAWVAPLALIQWPVGDGRTAQTPAIRWQLGRTSRNGPFAALPGRPGYATVSPRAAVRKARCEPRGSIVGATRTLGTFGSESRDRRHDPLGVDNSAGVVWDVDV